MLYANRQGKKILMVQTFADRPERGDTYHIKRTKRPLMWCLKVYDGRPHPVPESIATQCTENTISNIIALDPDIVGLGGMGRTAREIRAGLQRAGFKGEIGYWGADVAGVDAEEFLRRYDVGPPY